MLDEPTNDLDIDTLELLESLLQTFQGTLFLVSHDRAFLENTVTQVIAFEGDGKLTEFGGGYDDWQRFTAQRSADEKANTTQTAKPKQNAKKETKNTAQTDKKLSFKEKQRLESLPAMIENLETEQTEINTTLADADIYKEAPDKVKTLQARLSHIDTEMESAMQEWEDLEARL